MKMRPDDHRKKKNKAYKIKHNDNISSSGNENNQSDTKGKVNHHAQNKSHRTSRLSTSSASGAQLGSNSDRYADMDGQTDSASRDMREILLSTQGQVTPTLDCETVEPANHLSLSIASIEKVVECFNLSDILDLSSHKLIKNSMDKARGTAAAAYADYISDHMDAIYTVDHDNSRDTCQADSVIFRNTGQHLPPARHQSESNEQAVPQACTKGTEELVRTEANYGESRIVDGPEDEHKDELDMKESELEDWLDSVLDD